jgi:hypothetical protein
MTVSVIIRIASLSPAGNTFLYDSGPLGAGILFDSHAYFGPLPGLNILFWSGIFNPFS